MSKLSIFATITVQKEYVEDSKALIKSWVEEVLKNEKGTLIYQVSQDRKQDNIFYFYEQYQDQEAMDLHMKNVIESDFFEKIKKYATTEPIVKIGNYFK